MACSSSPPDALVLGRILRHGDELPDRIAADSIVNRLANNARTINIGDIDMRREHHHAARSTTGYGE